jgi:hypothetical protein
LSNIPGSVSRARSNSANPAVPNRTPTILASPSPSKPSPTKPRSQTVSDASPRPKPAANGTAVHGSINAIIHRTKPRSNTVNGFSPARPSPLSRNVITPSDTRNSRSSWKRQSVQVVSSTHTKAAAPTIGVGRTSNADETTAPPLRPVERCSTKHQGAKHGECDPPSAAPTAAFMKPVNKSATKAAKRMTNSIKPLIPTWTAGSSSRCDNMFRNSLSMIVR